MKIYAASSWRNTFHPNVVMLLRIMGHEVYDFRNPAPGIKGFSWPDIDLKPGHSATEYRNAITSHPIAARAFMQDQRAMDWADACVLILPAGRSAHLEAGWCAGRGKRTVVFTLDGEEPELMALLAHHICVEPKEMLDALGPYDDSRWAEAHPYIKALYEQRYHFIQARKAQ